MITFDLDEVRAFTAGLRAEVTRCDNGEGMVCATLDATLLHYAELCCKFDGAARQWARAVFTGRVPYDAEVDVALQEHGRWLLHQALETWQHGQRSEVPCYELAGYTILQAVLFDLYRLLKGWVTPKLAVGPAARQATKLDSVATDEIRERIASLPPLPADWLPDNPAQQALYRKLQKS